MKSVRTRSELITLEAAREGTRRPLIGNPVKPIETQYKGCWFRSRLEARWAVFFDTLGVKWWYEPEGFDLHFDYEDWRKRWDETDEYLLEAGIPQVFKALDGKKYSYLPDFYLPELNYWVEIKGANPTKEELLKAFFLSYFAHEAAHAKLGEANSEKDLARAWHDSANLGVYVIYGDIPWPFPERGNAVGYGVGNVTGGTSFGPERLFAVLGLCWHQCRLCSRIGMEGIGELYCDYCSYELEDLVYKLSISRGGGLDGTSRSLREDRRVHENAPRSIDDLHPRFFQYHDGPEGVEPEWVAHLREIVAANCERNKLVQEDLKKHDSLVSEVLNLDFFRSGHKTPNLQAAYTAARSARFEGRSLY